MNQLIISCEHGGNLIPEACQPNFKGLEYVLESHRGWDPGALVLASHLHKGTNSPFFYSTTSRLLVELNRSLHHPSLFSSYSKHLPIKVKKEIIKEHYLPYRNNVEDKVKNLIESGLDVIHLSVHSFTPVLNGIVRNCEIGLLYDPKKDREKAFCSEMKEQLLRFENWRVRFNYPYKGTADGFTTYLRKKFANNYIGIELEVNQALLKKDQGKVNDVVLKVLQKII